MPRYKVQTGNANVARALRAVPGIIIDGNLEDATPNARFDVVFGLNAWGIVREALPELQLAPRPTPSSDVLMRRLAQMQAALKPDVAFKKYQMPGISQLVGDGLGQHRWPCGAGKSLGSIAVCLAFDGPRLLVTRACNREGYLRELKHWTRGATAHVITGHDNGGREIPQVDFIIAAVETLQWHTNRILRAAPRVVWFDESDLVKSVQRWQSVPEAYGVGVKFVRRDNRAASAEDIIVGADFRFGGSATPFPNRPIDGYAQGDLIDPRAWGNKTTYSQRYCNRHTDAAGHVNEKGASNLDELRQRWAMVTHEVSDAEVRAEMPPIRIVPAFIAAEDQTKIEDADLADLAGENADHGLMRAALASRGYVAAKVDEVVRSGHKAVVLTGWRADAERTAAAYRKRYRNTGIPIVLIHGGNTTSSDRLQALEPFLTAPGGAVLIGTMGAIGRALDGLQAAAYAALQMLPFTIGELEQVVGRFPRLGRTISCLIELCIPLRTAAERVAGILLEKAPAIATLAPSEVSSNLTATLLKGGADRAFNQIIETNDEPVDPEIIL